MYAVVFVLQLDSNRKRSKVLRRWSSFSNASVSIKCTTELYRSINVFIQVLHPISGYLLCNGYTVGVLYV